MIVTPGFTMIPPDTPTMHDGTHFPERPHARQMREAAECVAWLIRIFDDHRRMHGRPYVPGFVTEPSEKYANRFNQ